MCSRRKCSFVWRKLWVQCFFNSCCHQVARLLGFHWTLCVGLAHLIKRKLAPNCRNQTCMESAALSTSRSALTALLSKAALGRSPVVVLRRMPVRVGSCSCSMGMLISPRTSARIESNTSSTMAAHVVAAVSDLVAGACVMPMFCGQGGMMQPRVCVCQGNVRAAGGSTEVEAVRHSTAGSGCPPGMSTNPCASPTCCVRLCWGMATRGAETHLY